MSPFVEDKLDELEQICRKNRVRHLYLFGSALEESFDPNQSDFDFLVQFLPGPRSGLDDVYFNLLDDLKDLLGATVDLVEIDTITNPFFNESVHRSKVSLYAA